jgi:hypothetical protein
VVGTGTAGSGVSGGADEVVGSGAATTGGVGVTEGAGDAVGGGVGVAVGSLGSEGSMDVTMFANVWLR